MRADVSICSSCFVQIQGALDAPGADELPAAVTKALRPAPVREVRGAPILNLAEKIVLECGVVKVLCIYNHRMTIQFIITHYQLTV